MLEKTTRVNFLYDFYQSLLTDKQRAYMRAYYLEDYSLGEIASVHDVSRQAVYDNVKRTEAMLEEYEQKLQLFEKFKSRTATLRELETYAKEKGDTYLLETLQTLKNFE